MKIPLEQFAQSYTCTSRAHCGACRDTGERGRKMRAAWGIGDFDCPHGVPWDGTPPPAPGPAPPPREWRGAGDVVAAVTAAMRIPQCGGCKKRQAALNKLLPFGNHTSSGS